MRKHTSESVYKGVPVARYYERNTSLFLRLGGGKSTGSIHRPLWGNGVHSVTEAFAYPYRLIEQEIGELDHQGYSQLRLLDLGCGVGGGMLHLAEALESSVHIYGVTISADQAARAKRDAEHRGLHERCTYMTADFLDLPALPPIDFAFAIEAFVQGNDAERFFHETAQRLRPGGRLVLIDDMQSDRIDRTRLPPKKRRWLELFEAGWHARSFHPHAEIVAMAEAAGLNLIRDVNLYPLLKLWRPRDRFIAWCIAPLAPLIRWHPYGSSLIGGNALQRGLYDGLIEYRQLVFERHVRS